MANNGGPITCPSCGRKMIERRGRFGFFFGCSGYPECKTIVTRDKDGNVLPPPEGITTNLQCPQCGKPLLLWRGELGPWLGCSDYPECRGRVSFAKLSKADQSQLNKLLDENA